LYFYRGGREFADFMPPARIVKKG